MSKFRGVFVKLLPKVKPSFSTTTPGNSAALRKCPAHGLIYGNQRTPIVKVSNLIWGNHHYRSCLCCRFIVYFYVSIFAHTVLFVLFFVAVRFWCSRLLCFVCCHVFSSFYHLLAEVGYSVCIETGYWLNVRCSIPKNRKCFSTPQRSCWHSGPPSLLSSGHRRLFPRGKSAGAWSWPLTSI
jgi:hypothetical protein